MPQVNSQAPPEALWQAVRTADIGCCTETLLVLTGVGDLTTHAAELRDSHTSADTIAAALIRLARRRIRRWRLRRADVTGYAVILPQERVAFAADRTRTLYMIELPGTPLWEQRPLRWLSIVDALATLINRT